MRATDIVWDTDGEFVDLPSKVDIPDDIDADEAADYLSDKFGFCIKSLCIDDVRPIDENGLTIVTQAVLGSPTLGGEE